MCRHVEIDIFNLFQTTNHNQQESIHFIITAFFFWEKTKVSKKTLLKNEKLKKKMAAIGAGKWCE